MIANVGPTGDHGGEAGLELVAVQEAVAVSIEAAKHLLDGRRQLCRHQGQHQWYAAQNLSSGTEHGMQDSYSACCLGGDTQSIQTPEG